MEPSERLARLYNRSRPLGMGILHYTPDPMTIAEAMAVIEAQGGDTRFDYLKGRVMKVDVADENETGRLYDRDNGPGAYHAALSSPLALAPSDRADVR